MDLLEQLDSRINTLLGTLAQLKQENAELRVELQTLRDASQVLKETNASLNAALMEEAHVRQMALQRVDALLQKIQDMQ